MAYTFSEPGDIKTIILYIVKNYGEGVDIGTITDIFMSHEFVDYFTMRILIDELLGAGLMEIYRDEKNDKYLLSDIGEEAISGFMKKIPLSVRKNILKTIKEYKIKLEKGQLVTAKYIKHSDMDHEARLCINEGGTPLLEIALCLTAAEDAHRICVNFKKNPQKVYESLLKILSHGE